MQSITSISDMQGLIRKLRRDGRTVGFVPTMGALHEGHLSLVRRSRAENGVTVVSIFVNPAQFGPKEDFQRYPRDPDSDLRKLALLQTDVVFLPETEEMYPGGGAFSVSVGTIGAVLCGATRPGHFDGVATVVTKLFNIVRPDRAYFGQKDFQQTVVIKKLVSEFLFETEVLVCPVVREHDGLAMSSRNVYLTKEERDSAPVLYRALKRGKDMVETGGVRNASSVTGEMKGLIEAEPRVRVEYIYIVDPQSLSPLHEVRGQAAILAAARIGNTRLIDNIMIDAVNADPSLP